MLFGSSNDRLAKLDEIRGLTGRSYILYQFDAGMGIIQMRKYCGDD